MYNIDISVSEVLSIIDSVREYLDGDDLIPEREQERGCPDEIAMIFDRIVRLVEDEKAKVEDAGYDAGDANGYHEGYLNGIYAGWKGDTDLDILTDTTMDTWMVKQMDSSKVVLHKA